MSLIALLTACNENKGTGADREPTTAASSELTTADTDTLDPCDATVASLEPPPGAVMVPLDQVVTVTFDKVVAPTDTYSISIVGMTGASTLAGDGLSMTFTPNAPFEPNTTYTVDIEVCAYVDSTSFTTQPEVPIENVEGNVYALRWTDVEFTEPGDPETLSTLPIDFVLLQIKTVDPLTGVAPSAATLGLADPTGNVVPACDMVLEEDGDFSLNPYYQFEGNLQIPLDSSADPPTAADMEEFRLHARVAPDGASLSEITLHALVAPEQFLEGFDCENFLLQMLLLPTCVPCTISNTGQCMLVEGNADNALIHPELDLVTTCGL